MRLDFDKPAQKICSVDLTCHVGGGGDGGGWVVVLIMVAVLVVVVVVGSGGADDGCGAGNGWSGGGGCGWSGGGDHGSPCCYKGTQDCEDHEPEGEV